MTAIILPTGVAAHVHEILGNAMRENAAWFGDIEHIPPDAPVPELINAANRVLQKPFLLGLIFPRVLAAISAPGGAALNDVVATGLEFMSVVDMVDPEYWRFEGSDPDIVNRSPTKFILGFRLGEIFMMQDQGG